MPDPVITSLQNERVKWLRGLGDRKTRRQAGQFVAEGLANLEMAMRYHRYPSWVVAVPDAAEPVQVALRQAVTHGARALWVSAAVMAKLATRDNPPPVLAAYPIVDAGAPMPSTLTDGAFWLALEGVRDPGNLGTIIRTAHAFGLDGIILVGTCCDPTGPDCVQAAMGSVFAVPLVRLSLAEFARLAQPWPGQVTGTHLAGALAADGFTPTGPQLLLMGSEASGLSPAAAALCHRLVRIPMAPDVNSLNLSVATGIMLYQLRAPRLRSRDRRD